MKTRMKFAASFGAILAAGAIAVTPAFASDGDADAAAYVGATTSLTPVQLVGGSGGYSFSSIVCAGVSSDVDAGLCTLTSTGSYVNIVCGTGTVSGSVTTGEPDGASDTAGISIIFVAGVGVATTTSGGTGGGVAILLDTQPSTDGSHCSNGFNVVGAAVING